MDLKEISYAQALIDLDIANARIVELSCQIEQAAESLLRLRTELGALGAASKPTHNEVIHVIRTSFAAKLIPSADSFLFSRALRKGARNQLIFHIDEVCGRQPTSKSYNNVHTVSSREFRSLTISGWAIPQKIPGFFAFIHIKIKNATAEYNFRTEVFSREDVAKHFSNSSIKMAGFKADVAMAIIKPGIYTVELSGETSEGDTATGNALKLQII